MTLKELLEAGTAKAGEQQKLAALLHIHPGVITQAKAGKRGLPVSACILLANYLGIESTPVIAASELITEKDEERRKAFYPFVMQRPLHLIVMIALIGTTAFPEKSQAAQGFARNLNNVVGIMSNYLNALLLRCINCYKSVSSRLDGILLCQEN